MHLPIIITAATALLSSLVGMASAQAACSSDFRGTPQELEIAQQDIFSNFAGMMVVGRDPQLAFDLYVPGEYVNHSPEVQTGRQNALDVLVPAMRDFTVQISNTQWWAGQGYGVVHYKLTRNGTASVVMDRYKFAGTCIVEHWDVIQNITGQEPNPIAFFD